MGSPQRPITAQLVAEHGLTAEEYQRILALIGREPTLTELGIFSAMWNEHCSYKSSKIHLKSLPVAAPWVIQGPGENAGVISIGDGLAVVFKMESHNHPSYIEPYQGAATATVSGCPPSPAQSPSTPVTTAIVWSTPWRSGSRSPIRSSMRRQLA